MKIVGVENNCKLDASLVEGGISRLSIFQKPDSSLLHNDDSHLYIPDYTRHITAGIHLVAKMDKVGKNIAERFAHRYYSEVTVGVNIIAQDLLEELKSEKKPYDIAYAFDNSAAIGRFVKITDLNTDLNELELTCIKNDELLAKPITANMIFSLDKVIEHVSRYFTLKTGDLIFAGSITPQNVLEVGDKLDVSLADQKLLELKVC